MEPKTKKWKNRKTNQKVKMCHILCFSKRLVATNEIRFKEVSDIGSMLLITTCQHSTTQFFTGRMPFLPPNQQRQSTEG